MSDEPRRTSNPPGRSSSRAGGAPQRQSQRASSGPYPRPSPSPEAGEEEEELFEAKMEEEEVPVASGSGQVRIEVRAGETSGDRTFQLMIRQQPEIGASAGLERITLGRLPIVPAPVIQVIMLDSDGEEVDVELPYLFCSCSLRQEDGISAVEIARPEGESGSYSALLGGLVRNVHRVKDLEDGKEVNYFVFEDMSVRVNGTFTLEFRLSEARPNSPKLAAVTSAPFDVVDWSKYPDIYTDLSKHLHEQSIPLYIPPLVLQPPNTVPPPASLNPFPSDSDIPTLGLASEQQSPAP